MTTTRLLALAVLIVAILAWPVLFGTAVANLAGAALLKLPPCDPDSPACQTEAHPYPPEAWAGNRPQLEALRSRLTWAVNLAPRVEVLRLRLADTEIAFDDRAAAAALLPPAQQILKPLLQTDIPPARSRILSLASYESYLIAAYQHVEANNWEAAVKAFRLALAFGAADMRSVDHQAYLNALAHYHAQQAEADRTARSAYLAGKYFARSGDWTIAEQWLRRAQQAIDWDQLSPEEQARTWVYLGRVHEQTSDLSGARAAYETAVRLAPKLREAQLQLLALLRQLQDTRAADDVANDLAVLGPKYHLGQFGGSLNNPEPATPSDGWTLVGYDLDEESLEAGGLLDLWLWWKAPVVRRPQNEDWLSVGDYWLSHQEVVNLAANPGFEWGTNSSNDLPMGYVGKYEKSGYPKTTPGGVGFVGAVDSASVNHLAQLEKVGIKTPLIQVEPRSLYLSAGWLRRTSADDGDVTFGRECFPELPAAGATIHRPRRNYSRIGNLTPEDASDAWVHVARVSQMSEDYALCQLFLEQVDGVAEFDRLLFTQLPSN